MPALEVDDAEISDPWIRATGTWSTQLTPLWEFREATCTGWPTDQFIGS